MKCTAFLCGGFSIASPDPDVSAVDSSWQKLEKSSGELEEYGKYYYPEFVAFNYGGDPGARQWKSMARYRFDVRQSVRVRIAQGEAVREHEISVTEVTLYLAPYGLMLYAVQVEQESSEANDITAVMGTLRSVNAYRPEVTGEFAQVALLPLMRLYEAFASRTCSPAAAPDYSLLVENGNKFKLFQIAEISGEQWDRTQTDHLLFEMGLLCRVGSYGSGPQSASEAYFTRTMKEHCISVFNNWKALALFDTFTILCRDVPGWIRQNWIDDYFNTVYISQLYVKIYLFRLNILFRTGMRNADSLKREFEQFERNCCFEKISYNFLPLEICRGINTGLDILSEKEQLFRMIGRENERREKSSDQRMNKLLLFLTCLTMFSAIWDSSCLFNELYPYDTYLGSNLTGYRVVAYSLLLLILTAILLNRLIGRRS